MDRNSCRSQMHNLCPFTFVCVLEVLVRWNNAGLEYWLRGPVYYAKIRAKFEAPPSLSDWASPYDQIS